MAFWSSQTLKDKIPRLNLITPHDINKVESATYPLRIGQEIFVTKDHLNSDNQHTKRVLQPNEDFTIPPGQFAFLLTEETVKVPKDAIAFISIKAGIKHKGLVNISGFHVDPGYEGKLLFSVYNAGPSQIRLNHNKECFSIWYASLDEEDRIPRNKAGYTTFPDDVLDKITTDKIYSLQALTTGFSDLKFEVSQKVNEINSIKKEMLAFTWLGRIVILAIFSFIVYATTSIISIGKFAFEQKDDLIKIIEYAAKNKDASDILEKQKKELQLLSEKQITIEAELNTLKKNHTNLFKNEFKGDLKPK